MKSLKKTVTKKPTPKKKVVKKEAFKPRQFFRYLMNGRVTMCVNEEEKFYKVSLAVARDGDYYKQDHDSPLTWRMYRQTEPKLIGYDESGNEVWAFRKIVNNVRGNGKRISTLRMEAGSFLSVEKYARPGGSKPDFMFSLCKAFSYWHLRGDRIKGVPSWLAQAFVERYVLLNKKREGGAVLGSMRIFRPGTANFDLIVR